MKIFLEKKNDTAILLWFEDTDKLPYKRGKYSKDFNGISIESDIEPYLEYDSIHLPGNSEDYDNYISSENYETLKDRDNIFETLSEALRQFAASFKKPEKKEDNNLFTVEI